MCVRTYMCIPHFSDYRMHRPIRRTLVLEEENRKKNPVPPPPPRQASQVSYIQTIRCAPISSQIWGESASYSLKNMVCVYVYVCICVYTHIHTYSHIYTHIHILFSWKGIISGNIQELTWR